MIGDGRDVASATLPGIRVRHSDESPVGGGRRAETQPEAVIVDLDGTLVDTSTIAHLAAARRFEEFHSQSAACPPNTEALHWACGHHLQGRTIAIVSGRAQKWGALSRNWLSEHLPVTYIGPFLRADGDFRPDAEVKAEIFHWLSQSYRVVAAIDDRPSVIELWRSLHIPVTVVPGWPSNGR